MKLETVLDELGLEKNKGKVYLALLNVGTGTAQEVANKAKLPRTTVHEIVQQLVSMGVVTVITKGRTRIYTAEPPQKLKTLLKEKERMVDEILPELTSLLNVKGIKPKIRFFEGVDGIKTVFEDTLTVRGKILRGILSMEDLYKIPGKRYMNQYVGRRVAAGIKLEVIRSASKEVERNWPASVKENRELHYALNDMTFPMTVYLYDKKLAIISTQKENFGLIIESEDLYHTFKNLFDVLWQVTRVAKKTE